MANLKGFVGQGIVGPMGPPGIAGVLSPVQAATPNVARRPSNQRFRSFAERYIVTRSSFFRTDPNGLAEDTWNCILDAKRAYSLIRRCGENVNDED